MGYFTGYRNTIYYYSLKGGVTLKRFKTTCCRCGFCCISKPCPEAIKLGWSSLTTICQCPALEFDSEQVSSCRVVSEGGRSPEEMGIGAGCCIKATVIKVCLCGKCGGHSELNYANLPKEVKFNYVKGVLNYAKNKV